MLNHDPFKSSIYHSERLLNVPLSVSTRLTAQSGLDG